MEVLLAELSQSKGHLPAFDSHLTTLQEDYQKNYAPSAGSFDPSSRAFGDIRFFMEKTTLALEAHLALLLW